jgi:hypothetical protein
MAVLSLGRRGRMAAVALLVALSGSLIPVANVFALDVIPATGGSAISADDAGTDNWTILTGPQLREAGPGELFTGSTTILNAPSAFRFKPGDGGVMLSPGCNMGETLSITSTQATLTVGSPSTINPCSLTFILKVQPATGKGLASNHITKTGTSGAPGGGTSYGLLTIVAGAPKSLAYTLQPSATNTAGTPFATAPVVRVKDQFDNNVSKAPVTLSITPGTGPAGATLTCPINPVIANSVGAATFTGCKIDTAGSYTLRASSGSAIADSNTVTVTGGAATRLAFKSYPAASTPAALTPQPRVAVVDAGGNTVTSQPATTITLAINKNASTFSCSGGLTATTVNGEATFTGCTQTTADTGYALTASSSFANTTGATFAVSSGPTNPPSLSLTTFCGTPTPISTSGPNRCVADASKSPAQANIKLPQASTEGVRLQAHIASNGANRSLTFEVSTNQTTWSTIGSATTNASGDASVFYRPSDNRYYRVTFAGAADLGAATSPLVRVVVRALVFLRPTGCTSSNPCRISLNDEIHFTVTARPNRAELPPQAAQFVVQRKSGSAWVDADIDALVIPVSKASGTALFNVVFNLRGTWRLRVNLAPTSVNANSFPTGYDYYTVS